MRKMCAKDTLLPGRRLAALLCLLVLAAAVSGGEEGDAVDDTLRDAYLASQNGDDGKALALYMMALQSLDQQSLYRIPTVVGEMLTLAQTYPAARTYLEERRDKLEMQVLKQSPGDALIWEWVALSEGLDGDEQRVLRVYDTVHARPQGPRIANFVWQDLVRLEHYDGLEPVLVERAKQWLGEAHALAEQLKQKGPDHEAYVEAVPMLTDPGKLLMQGLLAVGRDQEFRDVRAMMTELDVLAN